MCLCKLLEWEGLTWQYKFHLSLIFSIPFYHHTFDIVFFRGFFFFFFLIMRLWFFCLERTISELIEGYFHSKSLHWFRPPPPPFLKQMVLLLGCRVWGGFFRTEISLVGFCSIIPLSSQCRLLRLILAFGEAHKTRFFSPPSPKHWPVVCCVTSQIKASWEFSGLTKGADIANGGSIRN